MSARKYCPEAVSLRFERLLAYRTKCTRVFGKKVAVAERPRGRPGWLSDERHVRLRCAFAPWPMPTVLLAKQIAAKIAFDLLHAYLFFDFVYSCCSPCQPTESSLPLSPSIVAACVSLMNFVLVVDSTAVADIRPWLIFRAKSYVFQKAPWTRTFCHSAKHRRYSCSFVFPQGFAIARLFPS